MTSERRKWVIDALRIHVDGLPSGSFKDDTLTVINELTSPPAPSGWQQRIAAIEPWVNRNGPYDVVCYFCRSTRSVNSPTSQQHEPDCLWQNAVDALPPAPEVKE